MNRKSSVRERQASGTGGSEQERFRAYFDSHACFIPDFEEFLAALARRHRRVIRVNTLKTDIESCIRGLRERGAVLTPCIGAPELFTVEGLDHPGNTPEYAAGHCTVQALSSALAVLALDPRPGECILDLCAAPGSKTSYLAQRMDNRGLVVANEKKWGRLAGLTANLNRLGVTNCVTTLYSGEEFPLPARFDRVLVDAPCSGEGRHRMDNRAPLEFSAQVKKTITRLQEKLLLRAWDLLKPGGVLVYSTCSYDPRENEEVVARLLATRPGAMIEPPPLDAPLEPGVARWKDRDYGQQLRRCRRVYPHRLDTVGFFLARMAKPR